MDDFDGNGFKETPIEGKEAAQIRHMFHEVKEKWPVLSSASTVVLAIQVIYSIIKIGGPVALLGLAAGAFAKMQGWV